jgi:hypothetical protein
MQFLPLNSRALAQYLILALLTTFAFIPRESFKKLHEWGAASGKDPEFWPSQLHQREFSRQLYATP